MATPVRPHWLLLFVLVAAGYAVGYQLATSWFSAEGQGASFFPAAGVTLAALVLVTKRQWPVVLVAAGLTELSLDLYDGISALGSVGYTIANLVQPLVGALLLAALVPRVNLGRTRDLAAFLACAVIVAPAVGGAIGASTFVLDGGTGWARFAFEWWSGDGLGVLVVGAAILSLWSTVPKHVTRGRIAEGVALALLAVVGTALVFRLEWFELVYLPTALLLVIAFRIGTRGVALTGAVMAFIAAQATAEGHLYWAALDVTAATGILYLQLALAVLISAGLALAAEITQRERAAFALASARESMRTASEQAALYESERDARLRAELLERHAAHLAAAMTVRDIAEATIDDLESAGITIAVMGVVRGDLVETVGSSGIAHDTRERFSRFPLADASLITDTIRSGTTTTISSPEEYEARYPTFAEVRRQTGMQSITGVPLRAGSGRVIGALAVSATTAEWFDEQRRQVITAVAGQCGVALERAQLQEDADAVAADAAFLAELGETLDVATTARDRAQQVVELLVRDGAAFAAVQHDDDEVGAVTLASASASHTPSQDGDDAPPEDSQGFTTLQLRARGRLVGTLTVRFDADPIRRMSSSQLREVATRAAIAIDNALLYERERDVSHSLQLGLLGSTTELAPGTDVASAYLPGTTTLEVGGDWHDAFVLRNGTTALVVGDVVGHGLEAAVAMGQLRGAVRALAPIGSPSELLGHLDDFVEMLPAAGMATIAFVELDDSTGRLRYACAGHPPPLVVSPRGSTRFLWEGRSPPLGSTVGDERAEAVDRLEPGDTIVLYTDGLVERRTESLADGLERLVDVASREAGAGADALVDRIIEELPAEGAQDDVCVLVLTLAPREDRHFAYSFPAAPSELAVLRRALADWLEKAGCPVDARHDAIVAISEVAANAVEHAYAFDGAGVIGVEARLGTDGELDVTIRDEGTWRDPRPDSDRGRGLPIVGAIMEDVTVRSNQRGTVVRMRLPLTSRTTA